MQRDEAETYALMWRFIHLAVHRYGSSPTGELLMVLTLILLYEAGYYPTVSELADIVGLPKSSVSRYVSTEMQNGLLEEFIDPEDRRRRRLRPTELANKERAWHLNQVHEVREATRDLIGQVDIGKRRPEELMAMLKAITDAKYPPVGKG